MKKSLLLSFAMASVLGASAMTPLTPGELAALSFQLNEIDGAFSSNATVSAYYADESNPTTIKIDNFFNTGLPWSLFVNWDEGTVSAAPQTLGYDSSFENYIMPVSPEAAELASPMDPAFSSSKVTGTISADGIVLNPWTMVSVPPYFNSLTKLYDRPFDTKIVAPNATMTHNRLDWDDDYENLVASFDHDIRVYTEVSGTTLKVYGWDDLESCVPFTRINDNGKRVYVNNPADIIYADKKRSWNLCALPGTTWDEIDTHTIDNAAPIKSSEIVNNKEISFPQWYIVNFGSSFNNQRSFGSASKLVLDSPLPSTTGIDEVAADAEIVGEAYYNVNGMEVVNPENGLFVKVTRYADGTTKAVKAVK